jgi:hypothetical protein
MIHLFNFETGRFRKYINRILLALTRWIHLLSYSFVGVYFNRKAVPYD